MNKSERISILRKLKPATWYAFCQMEAMHDEEVQISRAALALKLDVSLPTLAKHLATWASHNLVKEIDGGFVIAQLDGQPSGISEEPIIREFKNAKDIIDYWCDVYKEVYGTSYMISNYAMAGSQVKKLLRYPDEDIRSTLLAIVTLYDNTWAKPGYTRPTLGQVCSWLYVQAQPYAVKKASESTSGPVTSSNLLADLELRGGYR